VNSKRYYNPQTNIFDFKKKIARSWDWYDGIWKNVRKCVFCDLNKRYVIFEKNGIVLTANLYPYTDGHLLIVPRRHIEYTKELTSDEWEAIRGIMYIAKKIVRKVFKKKCIWFLYREGVLGKGQKTVGHLHIHVIPYVKDLAKWNYQKINWAPGEVSDRLKDEKDLMEEKYKKYVLKYGKYTPIERRIVVNGVITNFKDEILLIKKKYSYEKGWQTPSGSVENQETLKEALKREIREETSLEINNIKFIGMSEDKQDIMFEEGFKKRWNLIFMHFTAKVLRGKIKAGDDAKYAKWCNKRMLKKYNLSKITIKILKKLKMLK